MKKCIRQIVAALVVMAGAVVLPAGAAPASAEGNVHKQLAEVRQATQQYHDVAAAVAAGYQPTEHCVPGMGLHYVNWALVNDPAVDHTEPEVLLYIPSGNRLRLVAVEWFKLDADDDPSTVENIPIFDRALKGPMTHGLPLHYDLHAWVWQGNPDGVFEDFNRNISCPEH